MLVSVLELELELMLEFWSGFALGCRVRVVYDLFLCFFCLFVGFICFELRYTAVTLSLQNRKNLGSGSWLGLVLGLGLGLGLGCDFCCLHVLFC